MQFDFKKSSAIGSQRGNILRLIRNAHGWLGLWGAVLGLLFGLSGFLLNHRNVMKIPAVKMEETEIQLPISEPQPKTAVEFTRYIQTALNVTHEPIKPKNISNSKPEFKAKFLNNTVNQPETFNVEFQLPQVRIQAEYVMGNQFATVKRDDANAWAFISRMHKGVGANVAWVLLTDNIAGAMIVLSITGVLLWTKMRGSRLIMTALIGGSSFLVVWFTLLMM